MLRDESLSGSSRCERCLHYIRAVGTFVLSHVGLFGLVVGYTIMGAATFRALEKDAEKDRKLALKNTRVALVNDLWNMTVHAPVLVQTNWSYSVDLTLKKFQITLVDGVKKNKYDGYNEDELQWTFQGALLYSLIVITTIGYGNVAPKTAWGRLVTILYAVVGIPLMLFCMSNIGDTMAQSFKFVYWKLCCYFCTRNKRKQQLRRQEARNARYHRYPSTRSRPGSSRHSSTRSATRGHDDGSAAGSYYGGEEDDESATYRRRTPPIQSQPESATTAVGPPPDVSKVPIILNKYVLESKEDLRVDLPPSPSHKNDSYAAQANHLQAQPQPPPPLGVVAGHHQEAAPPRPPQRLTSMDPLRRQSSRRKHYQRHLEAASDEYGSDLYDGNGEEQTMDGEEPLDKEQVTVPIWLCCALVTGYIGGGGVLFSFWEGWTFYNAAYFCFVTLTTIGFGDLVPGKSVVHDGSQPTLALCALYLLFGMALLAMSFNLVQEQVTNAIRSIGKRIGIVDDDEDDDDEDDDD